MKLSQAIAAAALVFSLSHLSFGALTLDIADGVVNPGGTTVLPMTFAVTAPDVDTKSVGYQIGLYITGPDSNLSITSFDSRPFLGSTLGSVVAPAFDGAHPGLYLFGDFLMSGTVTITDGTYFGDLTVTATADAEGPYQIQWFVTSGDAYESSFIGEDLVTSIPVTFNGATLVPEPASLSLLMVGVGAALRRRAR